METLPALVQAQNRALASLSIADRLEAEGIHLPQVDNPVFHHFGPGVYIREAHLPALSLIVGHKHKLPTLNMFMSGELLLMDEQANISSLKAPYMFTSQPGRKVALTVTECVWWNIWATEETDISKLEDMFIERSEVSVLAEQERTKLEHQARESDRVDFIQFCLEINMTPDEVQAFSSRTDDYLHQNYPHLSIRDSAIQGKGVFASVSLTAEQTIGPARINGKRTPLGRYVNHSKRPNAYYYMDQVGDIHLVASRPIRGTHGPIFGEEITVDYRQARAVATGVQP